MVIVLGVVVVCGLVLTSGFFILVIVLGVVGGSFKLNDTFVSPDPNTLSIILVLLLLTILFKSDEVDAVAPPPLLTVIPEPDPRVTLG